MTTDTAFLPRASLPGEAASTQGGTPGSQEGTPGSEEDKPCSVGVIVIHGVGECEPGWTSHYIVDRLRARCSALQAQVFLESYLLEDRGRTKPGSFFPAYVRRASLGEGRPVSFLELYWADLSKTTEGPFYYILAALRLFYEAPFILAHSFMHQNKSGYHYVLKRLILAATWLLRWPIAGMNTTAFVCALAVIGLNRAGWLGLVPLPVTLCAILTLLAIAGFAIAHWRMHHDLWLTDVSFATALFSIIAIAFIFMLNGVLPARLLATPDAYLALCLPPILYIWVLWSAVIAAAIAMLIPVYLKRMAGIRPAASFPLARPAAALGLVLLQGLIWKVLVVPPSIWIIEQIGAIRDINAAPSARVLPLLGAGLNRCADLTFEPARLVCLAFEKSPEDVLADAVSRLQGVFVYNSLLALYTAALFIAIIVGRLLIARMPGFSIATKNRLMPRVIMSQSIILFLLAGSLFNLYIYGGKLYENEVFINNLPLLRHFWLWPPLITMIIVVAYFFNVFQVVTASIIHIFRDIVDHQYRPRFDSLRFIMPKTIRTKSRWPRRARVQERLNVLVEQLVRRQGFDRVVMVAHSQGSVILYEYLQSSDDNEDMAGMSRIDVVTVGSPLTHLYQYYFEEYGRAHPTAQDMNPRMAAWTNLWRLDDPIGSTVHIVDGGFVRNVELGLGGHVDYWREDAVCDAILDAIAPDWRNLAAVTPLGAATEGGIVPVVSCIHPALAS